MNTKNPMANPQAQMAVRCSALLDHVSCNRITQILSSRLPKLSENLRISAAVAYGCYARVASSLNDMCNLFRSLGLTLHSAMGWTILTAASERLRTPSDVAWCSLHRKRAKKTLTLDDVKRTGSTVSLSLVERLNKCVFAHNVRSGLTTQAHRPPRTDL